MVSNIKLSKLVVHQLFSEDNEMEDAWVIYGQKFITGDTGNWIWEKKESPSAISCCPQNATQCINASWGDQLSIILHGWTHSSVHIYYIMNTLKLWACWKCIVVSGNEECFNDLTTTETRKAWAARNPSDQQHSKSVITIPIFPEFCLCSTLRVRSCHKCHVVIMLKFLRKKCAIV